MTNCNSKDIADYLRSAAIEPETRERAVRVFSTLNQELSIDDAHDFLRLTGLQSLQDSLSKYYSRKHRDYLARRDEAQVTPFVEKESILGLYVPGEEIVRDLLE